MKYQKTPHDEETTATIQDFEEWTERDLQERPGRLCARKDWLEGNPDDLEILKDQMDDIDAFDGAVLRDDESEYRVHVCSMGAMLIERGNSFGHYVLYNASFWPESTLSPDQVRAHLNAAEEGGVEEAVAIKMDERIDAALKSSFPGIEKEPGRFVAVGLALFGSGIH